MTTEKMALWLRNTQEKRAAVEIVHALAPLVLSQGLAPQEEVTTTTEKGQNTTVENMTDPTIVKTSIAVRQNASQETKEEETTETADAREMKGVSILRGLNRALLTKREEFRRRRSRKSARKENQVKFEYLTVGIEYLPIK